MVQNPIIIIGGPTASGKSSLALMAAKKMNGVVINSDALQIYQGIPVISAQPSVADKAAVPHHFISADQPLRIGGFEPCRHDGIDLFEQMAGDGYFSY